MSGLLFFVDGEITTKLEEFSSSMLTVATLRFGLLLLFCPGDFIGFPDSEMFWTRLKKLLEENCPFLSKNEF